MKRGKEFSLEPLEIIQQGKKRQKKMWRFSGGMEKICVNQKWGIPG